MLRGATPRAEEMAGTAVLRIVVSSDSINKATATSQGRRRLAASEGPDEDGGAIGGPAEFICRKPRKASPLQICYLMCPIDGFLVPVFLPDQRSSAVFGSSDTVHPPPRALISSTLASMRRLRISTSFRSFCSAIVCAVSTCR